VTAVFPAELAMDLAFRLLGVTVENLSHGNRLKYRTTATEGVVISKLQGRSYLDQIGVQPGDIIRQMDEIGIKSTKDFEKAIIKYRKKSSVVLLLQRGNQLYYINVKL
jgi:S1-C subfamily serine protease